MSPADDSGVNMAVNMALLSGALHLDEQTGIWRANAAAPADVSYPADHNAACFRLEDGSFWFTHRNRCIIAAVRRFSPDGFILDIGGGNGFVAQGLIDAGFEAALLEPGVAGAHNAKQSRRVPTVINATIDEAAIRAGSVPNIGLFDVLEHIDDDRRFVQRLGDIIRPGGFLYLTVPAFNWQWSMADVDAMHYRRYTRRTLIDVLTGFEVLYSTYLFQRLVPLSMLLRALPYRMGLARPERQVEFYRRDHAVERKRLAGVLSWMLDPEVTAIAAGKSLSVGSSLLVVARRRE